MPERPEVETSCPGGLRRLRAVRFRRLLDNAPLELGAEQLWTQLNLQLVPHQDRTGDLSAAC